MATTSYTTLNGTIVSENRAGVKRDYMRDSLGSTVALLDGAQTKTDTFFYWPYGEIRTQTGMTKTPFTFVGTLGYYMDIASSLFYVRMRHLRSVIARWLTADPLGPRQPAYEYVRGGPVTLVDTRGLQPTGKGGLCVLNKKMDWGICSSLRITICGYFETIQVGDDLGIPIRVMICWVTYLALYWCTADQFRASTVMLADAAYTCFKGCGGEPECTAACTLITCLAVAALGFCAKKANGDICVVTYQKYCAGIALSLCPPFSCCTGYGRDETGGLPTKAACCA